MRPLYEKEKAALHVCTQSLTQTGPHPALSNTPVDPL